MDEKLIDAVKKYPCLWDTKLDTYKCNETRDAAWEIIVKETNFKDSKTAKNRWKQLRDSHREVLKRIKSKKSGQAATKKKEWKYEQHMEFLLPYMANRDRTSNYGDETSTTDERNNDDSTQSSVLSDKSLDQNQFEDLLLHSEQEETANLMESIPPPSKKKRSDLTELLQLHRENQKRHQQQRIELKEMLSSAKDDYDEIDHFFLSLAKTTKKFPGYLQARVKRSCFNAVAEAEDSHLYSQHTYGYYTNTGESSSQQNISNSQQFEMIPPQTLLFSEPQSIQENTNMIPPQTLPFSEPQSIQENTNMIPPQTLPVSEPQSIQENTNMIPPQTLPVSEPQSIQENMKNLTESAPTKS